MEFEDGLRMGVLPEGFCKGTLVVVLHIPGSISKPLGLWVGPGLGVVVIRTPFQTKFQFCQVQRMGGIKLQLLCGVRIELAVGSLPYPRQSGTPTVW